MTVTVTFAQRQLALEDHDAAIPAPAKAYAKNKDRLAAKRAAKRAALRSAIAAGMLDAGPRGRATDR